MTWWDVLLLGVFAGELVALVLVLKWGRKAAQDWKAAAEKWQRTAESWEQTRASWERAELAWKRVLQIRTRRAEATAVQEET